MWTKLILAIQFLTILPVPVRSFPVTEGNIGKSSACFPMVGLLQGCILFLVFAVFIRIFPGDIVAALVVAALAACNGGFHLDGLADTFDALASRKSREKMLAIMKESTVGPIGVVAIVLALLLKYLLLKNLLAFPAGTAYVSLILTPVIARWSMVPALYHGRSARSDGLGKIFQEHTGKVELLVSTSLVLCVAAAVFLIDHGSIMYLIVIAMMAIVYLFSSAVAHFSGKKFGGLTGDNLGALSEMSEVLILLMYLGFMRIL